MRKQWIARGMTALLTVAATGALLWFAGTLPSSVAAAAAAVAVIVGCCILLWWTRKDLPAPIDTASWYVVRRDEAVVPPAMDYRLVRLRRDVRDALTKSHDRPDRIHPQVMHLSEHLLRERHGIELETEPERATAVMDDALSAYLSSPPTMNHRTAVRELDRVLRGVEQLSAQPTTTNGTTQR
ncbi:MAG: hypothetical protein WA991_13585 [Ornithinimicrobium sp.]